LTWKEMLRALSYPLHTVWSSEREVRCFRRRQTPVGGGTAANGTSMSVTRRNQGAKDHTQK